MIESQIKHEINHNWNFAPLWYGAGIDEESVFQPSLTATLSMKTKQRFLPWYLLTGFYLQCSKHLDLILLLFFVIHSMYSSCRIMCYLFIFYYYSYCQSYRVPLRHIRKTVRNLWAQCEHTQKVEGMLTSKYVCTSFIIKFLGSYYYCNLPLKQRLKKYNHTPGAFILAFRDFFRLVRGQSFSV